MYFQYNIIHILTIKSHYDIFHVDLYIIFLIEKDIINKSLMINTT